MKTTYSYLAVAAATLAAFGVHAQDQCSSLVAQIPSCAATCIQSAASAAGCQPTDLACQCASDTMAKINGAAIGCVLRGCGEQTGLMVQGAASKVCDCASSAGGTTAAAAASTADTAAVTTARTTGTGVVPPVPLGHGPVVVTTGSLAAMTGSATMTAESVASTGVVEGSSVASSAAASAASTGAAVVTSSGSPSASSGSASAAGSSSSSSGGADSQRHSIGLVAAAVAVAASFMMTAVGECRW